MVLLECSYRHWVPSPVGQAPSGSQRGRSISAKPRRRASSILARSILARRRQFAAILGGVRGDILPRALVAEFPLARSLDGSSADLP